MSKFGAKRMILGGRRPCEKWRILFIPGGKRWSDESLPGGKD
jgi:hypothetical protein